MPSSSFNIFLPQGSCMWYVAVREYLILFYTKAEEWSMEADRYSTMREIIKNTVSGYRQTSLWQHSDGKKLQWKILNFLKYLVNAFNHGNDSDTFHILHYRCWIRVTLDFTFTDVHVFSPLQIFPVVLCMNRYATVLSQSTY